MGGALAASGAGLATSIVANAGIAAVGEVANQVIEHHGINNIDAKEVLVSGLIGGVAGAVGGAGASKGNVNTAMSLGRQLSSRAANTGEIGLAFSYYLKNMRTVGSKSIYKELHKSLIKGSFVTTIGVLAKRLMR